LDSMDTKKMIKQIILFFAKLHPKNKKYPNEQYPQLWYCWPLWSKRIKLIHKIKTWLCGKTTGHEWSKTECGVNKNGIDQWCRWCDKHVIIPKSEFVELKGPLKEINKKLSGNSNQ